MAKKFEDDFNEQLKKGSEFDFDFKTDFDFGKEFKSDLDSGIKDEFKFDFDTDFGSFGDEFKFEFPEIKIDIPGTEPEKKEEPAPQKKKGLFGLFKKKEPEKAPEEQKEKEKDPFAFDMGFDFDSFNSQFESSITLGRDDFFANFEKERLERERTERERFEREQKVAEEKLRTAQEAARKTHLESLRRQRYAQYYQTKQNIKNWFVDGYYNWAVVWDQLAEERRLKQIDKAADARNYKRGIKRAAKLRAAAIERRKAEEADRAMMKSATAVTLETPKVVAAPIPAPAPAKPRKRKKRAAVRPHVRRKTLREILRSEQVINAVYTALLLCALTAVFFTGLRYANQRYGFGDRKVYGVLPAGIRKTAVELPAIEKDLREDVNIPVLMYHHIAETGDDDSTITFDLFEDHIRTLTEEGYTSISPDDLRDYVKEGKALPAKPIIITFDDGYLSNYQFAYPCLEKYGQKATIFVIGSTVGNLTSYKETGGKITPHFTVTQGRVMQNSGVIDLQSHTYNMHQFEGMDEGEIRPNVMPLATETRLHYAIALRADLKQEREVLAEMGSYDMHVMAYPYGLSTAYTDKVLQEEGIDITFTTWPGQNYVRQCHEEDMIEMHRWRMNETVDTDTLLEYLEPAGSSRTLEAKAETKPTVQSPK